MASLIGKAQALVEMVRAYDANDIKRAKQIGNVISKCIRSESQEKRYNTNIELNKKSKKLFPKHIRQNEKDTINGKKISSVLINIDGDEYIVKIEDRVTVISTNQEQLNETILSTVKKKTS